MTNRGKADLTDHDRAVEALRIQFGKNLPHDQMIHTNPGPKKTKGVEGRSGTIWPDILVFKTWAAEKTVVPKGALVGIAEVEEEVTTAVVDQWKDYSELTEKFQIAVPPESCEDARDAIKKEGIRVRKVLSWRIVNGAVALGDCPQKPRIEDVPAAAVSV